MDRRNFLKIAGSICVAVPCLNNKKTTADAQEIDDLEIQTVNICTMVDLAPFNFELGSLELYPDSPEKITHFVKIGYKHKTETWSGKDKSLTDANNAKLTEDKPVKIINQRLYVRYHEVSCRGMTYPLCECSGKDQVYCEITLDKLISPQDYEAFIIYTKNQYKNS